MDIDNQPIEIKGLMKFQGRSISVTIEGNRTEKGDFPVRANAGEPFIYWTHGGWAYTNRTEVPRGLLFNITVNGIPAEIWTAKQKELYQETAMQDSLQQLFFQQLEIKNAI